MSLETDVVEIKKDVEYIKKMIEDLTLNMSGNKDNRKSAKSAMDIVKNMVATDPNMKKNPVMQETLNKLFEALP